MLAHYAQKAGVIASKGIAFGSKRTYDYVLAKYAKDMTEIFETEPYPLTVEKMTAYLAYPTCATSE